MSFCKFLLLTALYLASASATLTAVAQQEPAQATDQLPLPDHALWRFGAINSTEVRGFQLMKFSPDGKLVATRDRKTRVQIWSVPDCKLVCEIEDLKERVKSFEFSADGKSLLTTFFLSQPLKVWSTKTGELEFLIKLNSFASKAAVVRFSKSGRSILVLGGGAFQEYSRETGKLISTRDNSKLPLSSYEAEAIDSTGQFYIVRSRVRDPGSKFSRLLDIKKSVSLNLPTLHNRPKQYLFSNDGNWIAANYVRHNRVKLWRKSDPKNLHFILDGHDQTVNSIAFSSDSRFLATAGFDRKIVIWDVLTQRQIGELTGHTERIVGVDFAPNSMTVASSTSGLSDATVIGWSIEQFILRAPSFEIESEGSFDKSWQGMGDDDPIAALEHVNAILSSADQAMPWVKAKLDQVSKLDVDLIKENIGKLEAESYAVRQAATEKLMEYSLSAKNILQEAKEATTSTEVKYRLALILEQTGKTPLIEPDVFRRLNRAVFLLELLARDDGHRPQALALLEELALNHNHADISGAAADTLSRIEPASFQSETR